MLIMRSRWIYYNFLIQMVIFPLVTWFFDTKISIFLGEWQFFRLKLQRISEKNLENWNIEWESNLCPLFRSARLCLHNFPTIFMELLLNFWLLTIFSLNIDDEYFTNFFSFRIFPKMWLVIWTGQIFKIRRFLHKFLSLESLYSSS